MIRSKLPQNKNETQSPEISISHPQHFHTNHHEFNGNLIPLGWEILKFHGFGSLTALLIICFALLPAVIKTPTIEERETTDGNWVVSTSLPKEV